jgi:hypothetical protein
VPPTPATMCTLSHCECVDAGVAGVTCSTAPASVVAPLPHRAPTALRLVTTPLRVVCCCSDAPANIMWDRRVVRGNTFAAQTMTPVRVCRRRVARCTVDSMGSSCHWGWAALHCDALSCRHARWSGLHGRSSVGACVGEGCCARLPRSLCSPLTLLDVASHCLQSAAAEAELAAKRQETLRRQREADAQKRATAGAKPRTPDAVAGRRHMDAQTDSYLETLSDMVVGRDSDTQTEVCMSV